MMIGRASVECSREDESEEEYEMRGSEQTRLRKEERMIRKRQRASERERERERREREREMREEEDRAFLFIAFYSFRVASDAA